MQEEIAAPLTALLRQDVLRGAAGLLLLTAGLGTALPGWGLTAVSARPATIVTMLSRQQRRQPTLGVPPRSSRRRRWLSLAAVIVAAARSGEALNPTAAQQPEHARAEQRERSRLGHG